MNKIVRGLCWAVALLLLAAGNYLGLIDDKSAQTLFIVMPMVAVLSIGGKCACSPWRRAEKA